MLVPKSASLTFCPVASMRIFPPVQKSRSILKMMVSPCATQVYSKTKPQVLATGFKPMTSWLLGLDALPLSCRAFSHDVIAATLVYHYKRILLNFFCLEHQHGCHSLTRVPEDRLKTLYRRVVEAWLSNYVHVTNILHTARIRIVDEWCKRNNTNAVVHCMF